MSLFWGNQNEEYDEEGYDYDPDFDDDYEEEEEEDAPDQEQGPGPKDTLADKGKEELKNQAKKKLEHKVEEEIAEKTIWAFIADNPVVWVVLGVVLVIIILLLIVFSYFWSYKKDATTDCTNGGQTTIVLDAGHPSENDVDNNGNPKPTSDLAKNININGGAEGNGIKEKDKVLEITKALQPKLEAKGYNVVLTRTGNEFVSNKQRAETANGANAALFLRIHNDSVDNSTKTGGFFFLYPDKEGSVNAAGAVKGPSADVQQKSREASVAMVNALKDPMTKAKMGVGKSGGMLGESKNGGNATHGGLLLGSVLSKVPVTLLEVGNLNSSADANWLNSKSNIDVLTTAMADGISKFAPAQTSSSTGSSGFTFPVKGTKRAYSGATKDTAPGTNGAYQIAADANQYYEWPTPAPTRPYDKYKGQASVSPNQEPGYYACRPSLALPNGCGRPHKGLDIYAAYGTPIVAPENGTISNIAATKTGVNTDPGTEPAGGGSGRQFTLVGSSGYSYTFMHTMGLSDAVAKAAGVDKAFGTTDDINKTVSVPVKAGDIIGYVGRTGGIRNPHLHLAVTKGGQDVDPNTLIDSGTTGGSNNCSATTLSGTIAEKAIALAKQQLGKPYVWGTPDRNWKAAGTPGNPPKSFDCSGLVGWVYYWATDGKFSMHGQTKEDYNDPKIVTPITQAEAQPGDLIYFTDQGATRVHHVAIYLGDNKYIHAPNTGDVVKISELKSASSHLLFARPVIK